MQRLVAGCAAAQSDRLRGQEGGVAVHIEICTGLSDQED